MNIPDDADGRSLPPEIVLRNRLSELFLEALVDPDRGAYVLWLRTYCRLAGPAHWQVAIPVLAEAVSREAANYPGADHRGPLEALLADFDLFDLRRLEDDHPWRGPEALEALRWSWRDTIELYPEFRDFWTYVVQRAERYWTVVGQLMQQRGRTTGGVEGAVERGVLVFNAGLFFEYHELLEDHWRTDTGDRKRFLQGMIQVAVGLHHWEHGNYRGATLLLREGAERLAVGRPYLLGLDVEAFYHEVQGVRAALEALEPQRSQPLSCTLLPKQHLLSG
jgi:uncharacterized protein